MNIPWTHEDEAALAAMWTWGHSSTAIGKMLDYTRNAIIGKAHRLGLTGQQGIRIGKCVIDPPSPDHDIFTEVGKMLNKEYDPQGAEEQYLSVMIAAVIYGRDTDTIHRVTRVDKTMVHKILVKLHERGVWQENDPPPAHWWHKREGPIAMTMDMIVAMGQAKFITENEERRYYLEEEAVA